jgi:hypothetical protein
MGLLFLLASIIFLRKHIMKVTKRKSKVNSLLCVYDAEVNKWVTMIKLRFLDKAYLGENPKAPLNATPLFSNYNSILQQLLVLERFTPLINFYAIVPQEITLFKIKISPNRK